MPQIEDIVKTEADTKILDRYLCEKSLKHLCRNVLGFKDWDKCHDDLVIFDGKSKNKRFKLYLLPRGHLKTSIVTIGKTIQDLLVDPDTTILLTSAIWNNSRSFLSEIKEYLTTKSFLPHLYGKFESNLWNSDQIIISQRKRPNKTPTVDTAGIEKTMTGQHYKVIRADDLVNRENVSTPDQIQKTINYFKDLLKLLEPDGRLEIVGTRWHDADLYGHILRELCKEGELDSFAVHKRKAVEDGKVIFPNKFNIALLENIKKQLGTYDYSCNYENEPINPETQQFKPPFRYWNELGQGCEHTITVDLAVGDKESSDFNVIMDATVNGANQLCAVDYYRGKCGTAELIDRLFSMAILYRVKKVGIESVAYQRIFAKMIEEECRKRNVFFQVIPIIPHKDKFSRIMALQPRYESGNLLLKQGMHELEDEFTRFPVAQHDDILDALAMQLLLIQPRYESRPKVYIPPEYQSVR